MKKPKINLRAGREGFAVIALAASLGFLARVLLFETTWGFGAALWSGVFATALIGLATDWSLRIPRDRRWIAVSLLLIPFLYLWHASPTLTGANTAAFFCLSAVWVGNYLLDPRESIPFVRLAARLGWLLPRFVRDQTDLRSSRLFEHKEAWRSAGRGVFFAIPVLVLFGMLLGTADARFAELFSRTLNYNLLDGLPSAVYIVLATFIAGTFLVGCIRFLRGKELIQPRPARLTINLVEAHVVLGLVSALFLAFIVVQFYGTALSGLSDAELANNARRGFFQLVAVAGASLVLVTSLRKRLRETDGVLFTHFRRSLVLNATLVLAILASAALRMYAYTFALGWTVLRVNTSFAMTWTVILFLTLILTNATRLRVNLQKVGVIAALGLLLAMHTMDPDAFIAAHNIERGNLSHRNAVVLARLSPDAVPAIVERWDSLSPGNRQAIARVWRDRYGEPAPELAGNERIFRVIARRHRDWRAWTVSEARLWTYLSDDRVLFTRTSR